MTADSPSRRCGPSGAGRPGWGLRAVLRHAAAAPVTATVFPSSVALGRKISMLAEFSAPRSYRIRLHPIPLRHDE
jgi:hypothetical protein